MLSCSFTFNPKRSVGHKHSAVNRSGCYFSRQRAESEREGLRHLLDRSRQVKGQLCGLCSAVQ